MKKVIVINAGPRKGWNTDKLLKAAADGAVASGAEVDYFDLYKLDKFSGCVSCFGCMLPSSFGKCICRDGLTEVLDKIRNADGLILGSPVYFDNLTSGFIALYERLLFQVHTYNTERPCCNDHLIPTMLVVTSNIGEEMYGKIGYTTMLEKYKTRLDSHVGPTEILICGDTLQVEDYSKFEWNYFSPEAKKTRNEESFPEYLDRAYEMGKNLIKER